MTENPLKNDSFWYGVGAAAGMIAVFALGVIYGPAVRRLFNNSAASANYSQTQPIVQAPAEDPLDSAIAEAVIPASGATLPVKWGDLGKRLVEADVVDRAQFMALYQARGGLAPNEQAMLDTADNGNIVITQQNSSIILNLLWALGLGNKNSILETGPMVDKQYGGAEGFASTGGWTLAKGNAMDHYSKHSFIKLAKGQQALVERVSQNIFRPCCNNSTYFPDCNHGMAMLGLLELMAAQGATEADMYRVALQVNAYWFPDTYLTLAKYMQTKQNTPWNQADPKQMLSAQFSSASGYRAIRSETQPVQQTGGGGGCGV